MFRVLDQFANHSLNDAYVAVQQSTKGPSGESNPEVRGQADDEQGCNSA
jgi:hypothetical protein